MKKLTAFWISVIMLVLFLSSCQIKLEMEYQKYEGSFFDTFDTLTQVVAYTKSEQEFYDYFEKIHTRFQELHRLYDIYHDYPGINNIKTINDNAGIQPVKVEKEIIDLILFSKEWYERTDGRTNIAMGSVLQIWHQYREQGQSEPQNAKLPPLAALQEAAKHTDIDQVLVDTENSTVYLADKRMR